MGKTTNLNSSCLVDNLRRQYSCKVLRRMDKLHFNSWLVLAITMVTSLPIFHDDLLVEKHWFSSGWWNRTWNWVHSIIKQTSNKNAMELYRLINHVMSMSLVRVFLFPLVFVVFLLINFTYSTTKHPPILPTPSHGLLLASQALCFSTDVSLPDPQHVVAPLWTSKRQKVLTPVGNKLFT